MSKSARRNTKSNSRNKAAQFQEEPVQGLTIKRAEPLKAQTKKQAEYIKSIKSKTITFGIGPAGTGKTYIAGAVACEMLESKQVDQIIVTRPAVEAGESLGFLPGELNEKYEPFIAPFRSVLNERLGKGHVDYLIKAGRIKGAPFAYMRGETFKNCIVILDEAQNATKAQLKLFLTRIGENCTVIVDGDIDQTDIRDSGLQDALNRLSYIPSVSIVKFGREDIVRSGIVGEIVQAYSADHFVQ